MFTARLNKKDFEVEFSDNTLRSGKINGKIFKIDLVKDKNSYHVISNHKSYNINILSIDYSEKKVTLKINNTIHYISITNELDKLIKSMGIKQQVTAKTQNLKAPMPGLVTDIPVKKGDKIKKGDKLLVLEAMKMENNLKAKNDSIIKDIIVKKGNSVEKNEVLIIFE
ncbi:MAG: biotin/lipoyl-binding protein [Bacteroidales bacterium]|nr:biotin/lipoyl-binding protein [Bacteroidales bacterium]